MWTINILRLGQNRLIDMIRGWVFGENSFQKSLLLHKRAGLAEHNYWIFHRKTQSESDMIAAETMAEDPEVIKAFEAVMEANQSLSNETFNA
jgi:hypothetical protein